MIDHSDGRGGPFPTAEPPSLAGVFAHVRLRVVGRDRELRVLLAALMAGRDVLLEGPPGTSKSTLLHEVTAAFGVPLVFVEGNAELSTAKLVGHHNPARVLHEDFSEATFVPGPLAEAMRAGGFLYIEEINRAPEDTLNALLGAIAERQLVVPRAGRVVAAPGFRLVASMNPFDNVGTSRISSSVHDRLCRIAIGYQGVEEEREIVRWRSGPAASQAGASQAGAVDQVPDERLVADAVALVRATRDHPELRQGSSVRGAIDLVAEAIQLFGMGDDEEYADVVFDALLVALSGRIVLDETSEATPEGILREIWEDHFVLRPHQAAPG